MMSHEVVEKRKRGRPVGSDGGRYNQIICLLSDDERQMLREASALHGKTQSEILRDGLKRELNILKYQRK